ncbi:MAG: SHOCT domain-containing protein [Proteobacteria bacterium]|nr:SHOCT domain-containing protein [Pseudomonadota bacterium]
MFHGFGNYGYGMGMGFGWVFMIIFWGLIIYLALSFWKRNDRGDTRTKETALEILKKRYARGEISKEEFERMKKDLNE